MKRTVKIIFFLFCVIAFLAILSTKTRANSIKQIAMDVYIDKYGNATVTEVWNVSLTEGTEGYRTYKDMGNSVISKFEVTDEKSRKYQTISNWNVEGSFNSKAYKCGIHNVENGIELCWGISSYGTRKYTLKYEISNFVTQYSDSQGIYFNFLNLDQRVNNAKITIHSDILFSQSNAQIWAFGYDGTINFNNGNIVLDSRGSISTSQYMVALIKFESNSFNTSSTSKLYFKNVYDEATYEVEELKRKNTTKKESIELIWIGIIIISIVFGIFRLPFIIGAIINNKIDAKRWKKSLLSVKFGENGKRLPNMKDIQYCRDIPCNGNIGDAYWICVKYSIIREKTLQKNILGCILLKWIRKGYIKISKTDKRII